MPHPSLSYPEAPADDPAVRISREVGAPRALVWSVWTDPARVSHW